MRSMICLLLVASLARADGGALRLSERRDGRRISVFTGPTPLRVGAADVSVLVQDAGTGKPLPDVPVQVSICPIHDARQKTSMAATSEAATNKLMRAAQVEFSRPGLWHVKIVSAGVSPLAFDVEVEEAAPPWLDFILWIGWPFAAIALFALHRWLALPKASA